MQHVPEHIQKIIVKLFDDTISEAEQLELDEWYCSLDSGADHTKEESDNELRNRMKERLLAVLENNKKDNSWRIYLIRSAAAILLIGLVTVFYFVDFSSSKNTLTEVTTVKRADSVVIKPGEDKAILTLADGSRIELDSSAEGPLEQQGNTRIIKLSNGSIQYARATVSHPTVTLYNTITTPHGGQYQVQLPDGTKVWLNAASSIRFPTAFNKDERRVEITGEVYLEVAHNASAPFWVKTHDVEIKVLGTHFNIMAYDNEEAINTTLLEGALSVQHQSGSQLLQPGNQLQLSKTGQMRLIPHADVEEAVAWKNGRFVFADADMKSIMRQVERWYNVEVIFAAPVSIRFSGQLNRFASVQELLRKLELTNEVNFEIDKKKIIVRPGARH